MEMVNGDGILHGTYHWCQNRTCGGGPQHKLSGGVVEMPANWADEWHEFAVEYDGTSHVSLTPTRYSPSLRCAVHMCSAVRVAHPPAFLPSHADLLPGTGRDEKRLALRAGHLGARRERLPLDAPGLLLRHTVLHHPQHRGGGRLAPPSRQEHRFSHVPLSRLRVRLAAALHRRLPTPPDDARRPALAGGERSGPRLCSARHRAGAAGFGLLVGQGVSLRA